MDTSPIPFELVKLCAAFNAAGGMFVDEPEAIAAHQALANFIDAAGDSQPLYLKAAEQMVEAFGY